MRRLIFVISSMAALSLLLLSCSTTQVVNKKNQSGKENAAVRSRSADAFAELDNGGKAPPPSMEKEEPRAEAPKAPAVEEPKKPFKEKPVEAVQVNPSRTAPDWVNSQPKLDGYFIGIGVSTSHGNEADDWGRARNSAYVELASSLKVHINSVIKDYFKENNMREYEGDKAKKDKSTQDSSYAQDTSFFVDQTLEGVEIADRWKDTAQVKYWMFVRLSKEEIARKIRERLEQARKKAVDYVQAAVAAQNEGRVGEAFKGYFYSYLALREYFGGIVEFDINGDGKPEILNHEIERAITKLASGMDWNVAEPNLKAVIGSGLPNPLKAAVTLSGKPVKNLPVAFAFQRGTGTVEGHVTTAEDGAASARVVKVFGEKKAIIGARVDVGALMENPKDAKTIEAKFGNDIDVKTGKFFIDLEELSAFIDVHEENMGEEVRPGSVAADIKEKLHAELGMVFTAASKGADMEISGEASTGDCTDMYSQRLCTARVNVTVTDRLHERQLFSKKFKIQGNGENDKLAGLEALRKVGPRIASEIIERMK
jgi:hypothetical protein